MLLSSHRLSVILLGVCISMTGCTHSPTTTPTEREAYLQQFIGQSSQFIDQNLDLKRLGYQQVSGPILSARQLSYVVQRPISIPLPSAGNGPVPIPISPADSYNVDLQCKITFLLKNNIATAVRTSGRTC